MKKPSNRVINLLLCMASFSFCFILLEIACRILPWADCNELQINNPYHYIETIGRRQHHIPYHSYQERVPLRFDFHSYYAATDGIICFHSNQFGARWITPNDQVLEANNILVLGDSFAYGHGLHYEDSFINTRYNIQFQKARAD